MRPSVFMSVPSALGEARDARRWTAPTTEARRAKLARGHRRPAALLPLGRRGPQARGEGVPLRARRPHHRGLRPDRDVADAHDEPPRRVPLRHRRQAAPERRAASSPRTARSSRAARASSAATTRTRPRRRRRSPPDGWFKTGDVGRFTDDGFLQIIDRKKDILVTAGGKNVPPANIEQRFADDPFIAHVVVYGDAQEVPRRRRVAERRRRSTRTSQRAA